MFDWFNVDSFGSLMFWAIVTGFLIMVILYGFLGDSDDWNIF